MEFRKNNTRRFRRRFGLSLMELILALAITVLVVGAIASAVHLHMVALTKQQDEIEQTHVARNILAVIATDIRSALQYKPFDTGDMVDISNASEEEVSAAEETAEAAGVDTSGVDSSGIAGSSSEPDENAPSMSANIADLGNVLPKPGFFGNKNEIMFDISRLPRMDQYNPYIVAGETNVSIPSDIKTTSYFVDLTGSLGGDPLTEIPVGGLYRRQLDHAVANYANINGYRLSNKSTTELLAPEIVEISFRYFDGEEWFDQWDSEEEGAFPRAVEISIVVDPRRKEDQGAAKPYTGFDDQYMTRHVHVVHIPIAEKLTDAELEAIEKQKQAIAEAAAAAEEESSEGSGDGG